MRNGVHVPRLARRSSSTTTRMVSSHRPHVSSQTTLQQAQNPRPSDRPSLSQYSLTRADPPHHRSLSHQLHHIFYRQVHEGNGGAATVAGGVPPVAGCQGTTGGTLYVISTELGDGGRQRCLRNSCARSRLYPARRDEGQMGARRTRRRQGRYLISTTVRFMLT